MFAYVAALSPNVLFAGGGTALFFVIFALVLRVVLYFYPLLDLRSLDYLSQIPARKGLKTYGTQLVSEHCALILVGLGTILLINLVVVVKICYYQQASLRPFSQET